MESKIIEKDGIEQVEITQTVIRKSTVSKEMLLKQKEQLEKRLLDIDTALSQFKK